jgi:ELWxxDGT repeat protein
LNLEILEDRSLLSASLVADINPGILPSNPQYLTNVNGELFFTADDGVHGRELWKSDGTAAGTVLVKDINPGSAGSAPHDLTSVNGELFFSADDGVHGAALWKSDGTDAGTVMVKGADPGGLPVDPFDLADVNGRLFFVGSDNSHFEQLFTSDGTEAGTVLVKDLGLSPGNIESLTNVDGELFFVGNDGVHGRELWKSDGTDAGTVMVKDINPGRAESIPAGLTNVNGVLYFTANDGVQGIGLWKSDGTDAGTTLLAAPGQRISDLTVVNGTLFFVVADANTVFGNGHQLWKSDGTADGTVEVADIAGGNSIEDLTTVGGSLYFAVGDRVPVHFGTAFTGEHLYTSDGTAAGTTLVRDITLGTGFRSLVGVGNTLFFSGTEGSTSLQVWQTDGTADGTVQVTNINPNGAFDPEYLTNVNGQVFFVADDGIHGRELFVLEPSSSTAAPTVESVVVNDGSVQRSQVTSLTVTFSTQVSLDSGALEVQRGDGSDVGIDVATSVVGGKTVAVITFTGNDIVDGSLPDGTYTLTVHSDLVHDGTGQALAQDARLSFFRLLGDVDGDGVIDDNDLAAKPTVTSVVLNEGDATGSQVHSITVHFSSSVTLGDGAFSLVRQDGSTVGMSVSTSVVHGNTVAVITFTGSELIDGALPDGAYTFTIHGDQVHDGLGLALGHDFSGDRSVDFFGADGSDQPDLVGLFHPAATS